MKLQLFLITLFSLAMATRANLTDNLLSALPEPVEEMDRHIAKEFSSLYRGSTDLKEMMGKFKEFKRGWVERMIEYLIRELDINEEGAKEARKNP